MFVVNEDLSVYVTRGDIVTFPVQDIRNGKPRKFQAGEVVRFKVFEKKNCEKVVLQKDFPVEEITEKVQINLTAADTKIGEIISKPKDYWYEVERNPYDNPETFIGYDEDGAKVFRLHPEGGDTEPYEPVPEDFPVIDEQLDMTSPRPVANQAIARAFASLEDGYERTNDAVAKLYVTPQMFGAIADGEADDTDSIQQAFNAVGDNGSVCFPRATYRIRERVILQNVSNIEIINHGIIKPMDGETPWIGTISLNGVKNAVIKNLKMDGNVDNVPETTTVGRQSMIDIRNCENIEFVNLDIRNTSESGITGESNTNITINNAVFENIGEHCVYIGGAACHGMTFNNIRVKNIGQNGMSKSRVTAVVKFRLHEVADEVHSGVRLNGVHFTDDTLFENVDYSCYHALASLNDVKDFSIENCYIKGETTAITQLNAVTEVGTIRNVELDGRDISAGVGVNYGTNETVAIESPGAFKIAMYDCVLKCESNMLAAYDLYNCDLTATGYLASGYVPDGLVDKHIIDGCRIDVGSLYRMNLQRVSKLEIRNTEFVSSGANQNQPVLYASKDMDVVLINCVDSTDRSKFIADNDYVVNLTAEGCTFVSKINDVTSIKLSNCKVGYATYINHDKATYSHVTRISDNKRLDITKHTVAQYSDYVSLDLRFSAIKKVTEKDLIILPTPQVSYTVSISDNILTITGDKGSNSGITYDVIVY